MSEPTNTHPSHSADGDEMVGPDTREPAGHETSAASVGAVDQVPGAAAAGAEQPATDDVATPDEAEQSELDLGVISTGSPAVDDALGPLEVLPELPVSEHPEVFEAVLGDLAATMAEGASDGVDAPSSGSPEGDRPFA